MPTLLQRIASRRNWLLNFTLQKLYFVNQPDLKFSSDTVDLIYEINDKLRVLRGRIDRDWKMQREEIKDQLARENSERLKLIIKQHKQLQQQSPKRQE